MLKEEWTLLGGMADSAVRGRRDRRRRQPEKGRGAMTEEDRGQRE